MSKKENHLDQKEQQGLYENAHRRIRQKKKLATHAVIFLAGSIIAFVVNIALGIGEKIEPFNAPWFVWVVLLWLFFLLIHAINVFFINKLMSREWEEKQMERLVDKQLRRIEKLQRKVEKEHPVPDDRKSNTETDKI